MKPPERRSPRNRSVDRAGAASGAKKQAKTDKRYARVTPLVLKWYREGMSYQMIADELNSLRFRTQAGAPFNPVTVFRICRRQGIQARRNQGRDSLYWKQN